MYKKEDVTRIFDREKVLLGSSDAVPEYIAVEIFGEKAVEFSKRICKNDLTFNGYGIGDYTLEYVTKRGMEIAATYVNICNIRDMIAEKGGDAA